MLQPPGGLTAGMPGYPATSFGALGNSNFSYQHGAGGNNFAFPTPVGLGGDGISKTNSFGGGLAKPSLGSVGLNMPGSVGVNMPRTQSSMVSSTTTYPGQTMGAQSLAAGGNAYGGTGLPAGTSFGGAGLFSATPFGMSTESSVGAESTFSRSASNAITQGPFNFMPGSSMPESSPMQAPVAPAAAPAPVPIAEQPQHLQPEAPPAASVPPAVRGRAALIERQSNVICGVTQEPCGSTLQLDDCISRCRKEVQSLAQQCRQSRQKYVDPEFPADARALYVNGQGPSKIRAGSNLPRTWGRASEGGFSRRGKTDSGTTSKWLLNKISGQSAPGDDSNMVFMPGPLGGGYLLSALAAMQTIGMDPREMIVWREPAAGVYGVRIFKDGEWIYEILDDYLPLDQHNQPACSRTVCNGEVEDWVALIEKAYAKVHGSYEAIAFGSEAEALEDLIGMGANCINMHEFQIWGELWQHLRAKKRRGYVMVATSHAGGSGLLSGYGYPLGRLEMIDGEMLVELENPWADGNWSGRWGEKSDEFKGANRHTARMLEPSYEGSRNFWMSIQDFCKHFSNVAEARTVNPYWQCAQVTSTSDRPSYPLISVSAPTQALFILSQADRHWANQDEYGNSIGLRVYRCRVVAPPKNAVGVKQNVSSPFKNLELLAYKDLTRSHSVVVEIGKLEPSCLYIAVIDSEHRSSNLRLRVCTGSAPRFRELSAPETQYLLQAQATAPNVADRDSFSSNGSADHGHQSPISRGYAGPYENLHYHPDQDYHEWDRKGHDVEAITLPRMIQACMATCQGNFRW